MFFFQIQQHSGQLPAGNIGIQFMCQEMGSLFHSGKDISQPSYAEASECVCSYILTGCRSLPRSPGVKYMSVSKTGNDLDVCGWAGHISEGSVEVKVKNRKCHVARKVIHDIGTTWVNGPHRIAE